MANRVLDDENEEKPLDPAMERVRRRLVRFVGINLGLLFIALMAVVVAIVYRARSGLDPADPAWSLIELAWSSRAALAIAPLQDVLGLGSEARMNLPGTDEGNWRWRFHAGDLTDELAARLRGLTEAMGRV